MTPSAAKVSATNRTLVEAIASYGIMHYETYLGDLDPERLAGDFWAALDFFFARACFQGRRDEVSAKVYVAVIDVLAPNFANAHGLANYEALRQQRWKPIEHALSARIGKGHVGKARDIAMVLSALDFIGRAPERNIVRYSLGHISAGRLNAHHVELQRSQSPSGIVQVGPKIAALYLRDVVWIFQLHQAVSAQDGYCLQPVDTWVRKLARRLNLVDENATDQAIQEAIVSLCECNGVSPILFNQGAWYVGINSFDVLLDLLDDPSSLQRSNAT